MSEEKKLYKVKEGAVIGGVCLGLSERFNVDVSVVRIITVLILLLSTGVPVLLIYLVMYLVLPEKSTIVNKSEDYSFDDDDYIY